MCNSLHKDNHLHYCYIINHIYQHHQASLKITNKQLFVLCGPRNNAHAKIVQLIVYCKQLPVVPNSLTLFGSTRYIHL